MIHLRSFLFNAVFYINLIAQMILFTPYYFLAPRRKAWVVPKNWVRSNHWLLKKIVGTRYEVEGLENLPEGSFIFAPKHQSFWDAYALIIYLDDPVYILKRELTWIPLFGWYIAKMRMIPVNRGDRSRALKAVTRRARQEMAQGRQLIIYPEGTRRTPGAEPRYKWGTAHLYAELGVPVVPVAMNPGLFWPRRKFLRYPGTIRVRMLPPIQPGLDKETFLARLTEAIESECDAMLLETAGSADPPPFPPEAAARVAELRRREDAGLTAPAREAER